MSRFFIKRPDIKPRAQSQHILAVDTLSCAVSCELPCSIRVHLRSIVLQLSARVPFVFTPVHSCSLVFHWCSLVFHWCALVFYSCSLVFRLVWSFRSDPEKQPESTVNHNRVQNQKWDTFCILTVNVKLGGVNFCVLNRSQGINSSG